MHRLLSIQNIIFMTLIFFSSFVLAIESNKPIDAVLADTAEQAEIAPAINFENTIPLFTDKGFKKKTTAVETLAKINDARVLAVFQAMLTNKLYYVKSNQQVVFFEKQEEGFRVTIL